MSWLPSAKYKTSTVVSSWPQLELARRWLGKTQASFSSRLTSSQRHQYATAVADDFDTGFACGRTGMQGKNSGGGVPQFAQIARHRTARTHRCRHCLSPGRPRFILRVGRRLSSHRSPGVTSPITPKTLMPPNQFPRSTAPKPLPQPLSARVTGNPVSPLTPRRNDHSSTKFISRDHSNDVSAFGA